LPGADEGLLRVLTPPLLLLLLPPMNGTVPPPQLLLQPLLALPALIAGLRFDHP
jgi:hypothetical protein